MVGAVNDEGLEQLTDMHVTVIFERICFFHVLVLKWYPNTPALCYFLSHILCPLHPPPSPAPNLGSTIPATVTKSGIILSIGIVCVCVLSVLYDSERRSRRRYLP